MVLFIAELLVCFSQRCVVYQEVAPVLFKDETLCLDYAERKLHELHKPDAYQYAFARCKKIKENLV